MNDKPTIFIMTRESYDDYEILGAFSTVENAEAYLAAYADADSETADDITYDEWEINPEPPRVGGVYRILLMKCDGKVLFYSRLDNEVTKQHALAVPLLVIGGGTLEVVCEADSVQQAIAIAQEKRIRLLETNTWDAYGPKARAKAVKGSMTEETKNWPPWS